MAAVLVTNMANPGRQMRHLRIGEVRGNCGRTERISLYQLREGGLLNLNEDFKSFHDALADVSLRSAQNHGSVHGAAIERYRGARTRARMLHHHNTF